MGINSVADDKATRGFPLSGGLIVRHTIYKKKQKNQRVSTLNMIGNSYFKRYLH